jgi:DNA repair protein RadA/Sms
VPGLERRLREAARLGFRTAVVPKTRAPLPEIKGLQVAAVSNLREAIGKALIGGQPAKGGSGESGGS